MIHSARPALFALVVLSALPLLSSTAWAQEGKAKLEVMVAKVSTSGASIDPALKAMAADFKRNGLAFTNYALASTTKVELTKGKASSVKLPKGNAELTLLSDDKGKLRIKVSVPGSTSEISMTPGGEAYLEAGPQGDGKVFLVLRR